ncbi:hypothetical protein D3C76_1492070 [compost metagenome]
MGGIPGYMVHRHRHLIHCRGGLLDLAILLAQSMGSALGHRLQLMRRRSELIRRRDDGLQGLAQDHLHPQQGTQ